MVMRLLPILVLLSLAIPARAEPPKREAFEIAVDNAMHYLANAQNPDGSWPSGQFGGRGINGGGRDPAITALCVMAFLSSGHVPGEGKYGGNIERGIKYVSDSQQQNGVFSGQQFGMTVMYSHGICTLMVAEVIGLTSDRQQAARLREQLAKAVKLINSAQSRNAPHTGGWRYSITASDADISVTGWQVMALRAAKNVGCDVPATVIDRAVEYVKSCYDPATGGYRYTTHSHVTVPCTGASILSLELCGKQYHKSEQSLNAASFLCQERNLLTQDRPHFFYGIYYAAQAMFQIGGEYWKLYRGFLHAQLLTEGRRSYPQRPGGFWVSTSPDDANAGTNYCTAMAVLALTVEYRFLPIYQRSEEPDERAGK
ncbi:MAG: prenyltransferase [Gemmataceae bacterium]|nr:prenyltransferase [Gemmataceae bacterium]